MSKLFFVLFVFGFACLFFQNKTQVKKKDTNSRVVEQIDPNYDKKVGR